MIDGDDFRSLISFDLSYKLSDRIKQNKRVLGLAGLVIKNGYFPIISSVYLDPKIYKKAKKMKIRVINVISSSQNKVNVKLKKQRNVVGKSIKQPKINCELFVNSFKRNVQIK